MHSTETMSAQLPRCVTDPLGTVASFFDAAATTPAAGAEDGDWGVRSAFREALLQLTSRELVERVPEINAVGVEHVPPGALVRFRCMVQDMYNPEYYVGAYKDASGRWRTTKYTEDLGPADFPGQQPADRKIWERRVLYCVPLPGESAWVRRLDGAGVGAPPSTPAKTSEGTAATAKRARDVEDVEMDAGDAGDDAEDLVSAALAGAGVVEDLAARSTKQHRGDGVDTTTSEGCAPVHVHPDASTEDALNLPLGTPTERDGLFAATPCIVKMYGDEDDVKLNDVLELVGVLGIAPGLSQEMDDASEAAAVAFTSFHGLENQPLNGNGAVPLPANQDLDFDFMDEARAHNPPTSVVPRFHVLAARRASPQVFAIGQEALESSANNARDASRVWDLKQPGPMKGPSLTPASRSRGLGIREKILAHLAFPLGGDTLAAEYVFYSLLSRVHTRSDDMPIGKFGVTLLGAPESESTVNGGSPVANYLASAVAQIFPAVAHARLTIDSLNARPWFPKKDYATNRLRSGPLQLASGSLLLLDETTLAAGTLTDVGVRNLRAIAETTQSQSLEMDFQFHRMSVPTDVAVVNVSASKTNGVVEGLDASVMLRMTAEPKMAPAPDAASLLEMRAFLARAKSSDHTISKASGSDIERAMVAARAADQSVTQENFHRWLTMARLTALSCGETELQIKHWDRATECERIARERARVC